MNQIIVPSFFALAVNDFCILNHNQRPKKPAMIQMVFIGDNDGTKMFLNNHWATSTMGASTVCKFIPLEF